MAHVTALVLAEKQGNQTDVKGDEPKLPDSRKRASWDDGLSIEDSEDRYQAKRDEGSDILSQVLRVVSDTFNSYIQEPDHRARNKQNPDKKPVAFELSTDTVIRGLEDFLASQKVKTIARELARKAAVVYRAIEKEF